ncbi:MAG: hypothetical protein ABIR70_21340 [Bryobacteraceae bacterium]
MRRLAILTAILSSIAFAQPQISAGGVLDGAGFVVGQAVAPGSLVSIFGSGLATSLLQGDTVPLSTSIGGTSVTMNGIPAPLYFVSGGQVNAQVPWNILSQGATAGTANVVVSLNGTSSPALSVNVGQFSPNVFSAQGFAIAITSDGLLAAPPGAIAGLTTRPARVGETLVVYANGLGPVTEAIANGAPGNPLRFTATVPQVLFGGVAATPAFSGLTPQFPGVNQINVVVPAGVSGNAVPLQIRVGGITSSDKVVIAVGP